MEKLLLNIGAAYIRVSDERQDEYSPTSQLSKIREYAAKEGYQIPYGQYAIHVISDVPVVACFGRLDVRQTNMAYYSPAGYGF